MKREFLIALSLLAGAGSMAQTQPSPSMPALSATGGRYIFGQVSSMRKDQYMLDTQTGRLWNKVCVEISKEDPTQCLGIVLEPVQYLDAQGKSTGTSPSK